MNGEKISATKAQSKGETFWADIPVVSDTAAW